MINSFRVHRMLNGLTSSLRYRTKGHQRISQIIMNAFAACCVVTGHWSLGTGHSPIAHAAVPHLIRYQGQAVDAQDVPLQGPYRMTFRLYDAETGGQVIWQETQTDVPVNQGRFSILLGQVTALNIDWSRPGWLSTQIGTDPELLPRQRITSVPLAMRAEVAERLAGSTDIGARVFNTLSTSIPNETDIPLSFNGERWDTDAVHDLNLDPNLGAYPTRLVCRTPGKYLIIGHVSFAPSPTGRRFVTIRKNGSADLALQTTPALPMGSTVLSIATFVEMGANEYVELYVRQGSGGALDVQPSGGSWAASEFGMTKLP